MNYFFLFPFVLFFLCSSADGQNKFEIKNREIKSDIDLLKTTVWIHAFDNKDGALGTGYLFYNTKKNMLYIITNSHILGKYSNLSFSLKKEEKDNSIFIIDSLQDRTLRYKNDIDLSAIRIDNIKYLNLYNYPYFKVFTEKNIITESQIKNLDLFDENIIALSYAGISFIQSNGIPLIIKSSLATSYSVDFNNAPEFCITANLTHGNSGSPIVLIKKTNSVKQYSLLGTYYFTFGEYQNISIVKKDTIKWFFDPVYNAPIKAIDSVAFEAHYSIGKAIKASALLSLVKQEP